MSIINYDGIDEADLVHALYHGTPPLGMGALQHIDGLSVEEVRLELATAYKRPPAGIPHLDHPNQEYDGRMYFDYYHGHPLKVRLDTKAKTFEGRLYDRDAPGGDGAAQRIVDQLRAKTKAA